MSLFHKLLVPTVSFIIETIIIALLLLQSPENITAGKTGPHIQDIDKDVLKLSAVF